MVYKVVHFGVFVWCTVEFDKWIYFGVLYTISSYIEPFYSGTTLLKLPVDIEHEGGAGLQKTII